MINKKRFFDSVRKELFGGKLTQSQVSCMEATIDEWNKRGLVDLRWLAYMFATAYHEVGKRMIPVREGFATTDAGARKVVAKRKYGKPDFITEQVYYGRGLVQLTWADNYKKMGSILDVDLYRNPDLALDPNIASQIMFEGMIRGTFTGKKLSDYFNDKKTDWVNARKIINALDKAELIAGYAKKFYVALA